MSVTIGEIYDTRYCDSGNHVIQLLLYGAALVRLKGLRWVQLKTLTVATDKQSAQENQTMPKDRSFQHRIQQSNIDRQRNQAYFMSRPGVSAPAPQEPKVGLWQRIKTFAKNFWGQVKEFCND